MLAELDPPYESREELKIGRMLDQYGLPFFYEQPTVIYNDGKNEIWHPTFTLPQYGAMVVDYVPGSGQMTGPILKREGIYQYNQIPAVLLGAKDLDKSNWAEYLYAKILRSVNRPIYEANYGVPGKQN